MSRWNIHRRTLLRGMLGAGAVSIGLPMLEAFYDPPRSAGRARAQASVYPRRMGWWFWGNGVLPGTDRLPDLWNPDGPADVARRTGDAWSLSPLLMPLSMAGASGRPLKEKLVVLSDFHVLTPNTDPHGSGPAGLFAGDNLSAQTGGVARTGTFWGPSFDQIIAEGLAATAPTPFRSLEVGVQRSTGSLSYTGPYAPNPPETSPVALFARIFGEGFRAPGGPLDPNLGLRGSVLDAVGDRTRRLRDRLGTADRARLDQHLEGIRTLESQIALLQADRPEYPACDPSRVEPMEDPPDIDGRPNMRERSRLISDLVAMALACDQTRVFSVMYSQPVNNTLFGGMTTEGPWQATAGHHQLTHDEPDPQPEVELIIQSIIEDFAYFLRALDAIPEGEGEGGRPETLLDHCGVLGTTDVSYGRDHSIDRYPLLLAGSCGGAFVQDAHIRAVGGDNATKVIFTLLNTMLEGTVPSFGRNGGLVSSGVDLSPEGDG